MFKKTMDTGSIFNMANYYDDVPMFIFDPDCEAVMSVKGAFRVMEGKGNGLPEGLYLIPSEEGIDFKEFEEVNNDNGNTSSKGKAD